MRHGFEDQNRRLNLGLYILSNGLGKAGSGGGLIAGPPLGSAMGWASISLQLFERSMALSSNSANDPAVSTAWAINSGLS